MSVSVNPALDCDAKIWSYMNIAKFVYLICGNLYFPRTDMLGDRFEGKYLKEDYDHATRALKEFRLNKQSLGIDASEEEFMRFHFPSVRRYVGHKEDLRSDKMRVVSWLAQLAYISCWHMNAGESAAMWGLYLKSDEGIAVESTGGVFRTPSVGRAKKS